MTLVPRYYDEDGEELTLEDIELELDSIEAQLCKRSLHRFVEKTWEIIEPGTRFRSNWHIRELCAVLEQVTLGRIKRLIINVPPGTMKSLLVSVFWPAWEWARNAARRYLTASYSQGISIRDNLKLRKIVTHPWYVAQFGVELTGDQNAKQRFDTTATGWRFGTSVGGGGTGEHPDVIIIDDPHTADEALSDVERAAANTWYDSTVSTRGVIRDVVVIIIMQRLHEDDLTGHVLSKWEKGTYTHVMFPMRFERARADIRDHRSVEGELLWPEVIDEPKIHKMEVDLQELAPGQMQQNPLPKGGTLFKREWFKIVTEVPAGPGIECRGWDTAATENAGDWTVGVRVRKLNDGRYVVRHVERGQWAPGVVETHMKLRAQLDGISVRQREEKEPGSSGKTVIEQRKRLMNGFDYEGVQIDKNKVTRSRPLRAQFEHGNVYLLAGDWNEAYIDELVKFPFGKKDDQVDATSCAFNDLNTGSLPIRQYEVALG